MSRVNSYKLTFTKIDFALALYLCHVIRKAQGNDGRNKELRRNKC